MQIYSKIHFRLNNKKLLVVPFAYDLDMEFYSIKDQRQNSQGKSPNSKKKKFHSHK